MINPRRNPPSAPTINGFPSSLRLSNATKAPVDGSRFLARLKSPGVVGKPLLTAKTRAKLAALHLQIEGNTGGAGDAQSLKRINHGSSQIWIRATHKLKTWPTPAVISRALGRALAWTAPAYRLPKISGRDAVFCARPDVLLLRALSGQEKQLPALMAKLGLKENRDKSRYLGGWRYLMLGRRSTSNALQLHERLRLGTHGVEAELEYVPLASPYLSPLPFTPNDELFSTQWNMRKIEAPLAWALSTGEAPPGGPRVIVAVIDSGCELTHADLSLAYVSSGTNVSDPTLDGSPVISVVSGTLDWHGTAVTGVIAAAIDNLIGLAGLAGRCGILPVALNERTTVDLALAIRYAAENGARVINLSMDIGSFWFERFIRSAIDDAIAAGCVVCAAAGNGDASPLVLPAGYPPVMACGGSDKEDQRWRDIARGFGSHFGDTPRYGGASGVSVVAPAVDIVSTDFTGPAGFTRGGSPRADYLHSSATFESPFNATSAATPHVSGTAALLLSLYPALTAPEVRRIIERTAEKVGDYTYTDVVGYPSGTRHPQMGYGRLNAFRALDLGDVMIADWPGDDGIEPSTPPGGDFWSSSDLVIRPGDDGVFAPSDPLLASVLVPGRDHTVSLRVRNLGPAEARNVHVEARITPWVALEFVYPGDWTEDNPLHLRPATVIADFALIPAGGSVIAKFTLTAAQVAIAAGWGPIGWHPCALGLVTSDNDYAFQSAATGARLQMLRNNLVQRNLTVMTGPSTRSLRFPFVIGHPASKERTIELVVDGGWAARDGKLQLVIDDTGAAFPVLKRAQGFAAGPLKVGKISGGKLSVVGKRRVVTLHGSRLSVRLTLPKSGRYALHLMLKLPRDAQPDERFAFTVAQRSTRRGTVGGAKFIYIVDGQT